MKKLTLGSKLLASLIVGIILLTLVYSIWPGLLGYRYDHINPNAILEPPSWQHLFGTDALGRDLLVRVLHGARMSLAIALLTGINALVIGVSLGTLAGYIGGWFDEAVSKLIDFLYSLPDLLVLSLIALFMSRSTTGIVIGLAFINWMDVARLARAETKKLKNENFIEASRVTGLSHLQIITHHILPNAFSSILVALSFVVPRAILSESTLSFIGLGIAPPDTSWGTLTGDAWSFMRTDPYLLFFPALMIFCTVYCFNYFGDLLKSYYSPRNESEHLLQA